MYVSLARKLYRVKEIYFFYKNDCKQCSKSEPFPLNKTCSGLHWKIMYCFVIKICKYEIHIIVIPSICFSLGHQNKSCLSYVFISFQYIFTCYVILINIRITYFLKRTKMLCNLPYHFSNLWPKSRDRTLGRNYRNSGMQSCITSKIDVFSLNLLRCYLRIYLYFHKVFIWTCFCSLPYLYFAILWAKAFHCMHYNSRFLIDLFILGMQQEWENAK